MVSTVTIQETAAAGFAVRKNHYALPGAGENWLKQAAIGLNPLDLSQRSGAARVPLPSGSALKVPDR